MTATTRDFGNIPEVGIVDNVMKNFLSDLILQKCEQNSNSSIMECQFYGKWIDEDISFFDFLKNKGFKQRYITKLVNFDHPPEDERIVVNYSSSGEETLIFESSQNFINFSISKKEIYTIFLYSLLDPNRKDSKEKAEALEKEVSLKFKNEKAETKEKIYMFCENHGNIYISEIGKDYFPIIKQNYDDVVVEKYEKVILEFSKKESSEGNIAIFRGPPGCGKTYLIRSLVGDLKGCCCIYLSPAMLASLAAPTLLTQLLSFSENHPGKRIVILLEDADQVLAPRMNDNITDIATLLNLADGILGKILNIKIIATTNQEKQNFDKAILRPGRLLINCEVGKIDLNRAISIFNRETKKFIIPVPDSNNKKNFMTLAEAYELSRLGAFSELNETASFYDKVGF